MSAEIMQLVDDFEQIVNAAVRVPMTARVMLDERRCLDLLDQMRVLVPEEIRQARRIQQDRERTLQEALEQSEKLTRQAEDRAERLVRENGLLRQAEQAAAERAMAAQQQARQRREGADQYAADMLTRLAHLVAYDVQEVEGGLESIGEE
jgi:vacuolar-type H+-ATPase subunit H